MHVPIGFFSLKYLRNELELRHFRQVPELWHVKTDECASPFARRCTIAQMSVLAALLTEETLFAATFAADHRVVFRVTTVAETQQHFSLEFHGYYSLILRLH